jgi:hypothetical protein
MFGRKKSTQPEAPAQEQLPAGMGEVYVMPDKYVAKMPTGNNGPLIIAVIVLVAVIIITGGYVIYDMVVNAQKAQVPTSAPTQIQPIEEPPAPVVEAPAPVIEVTTTPTTTSEVVPEEPAVIVGISKDSDGDGLTDIEETVYGTLPSNSDSDGDGFKDGDEIANGYSPIRAGSAKLVDSPFISALTSVFADNNFKTIYPKDWVVSNINENHQILITSGTGEVIRISVKDNLEGLSALAWYLRDRPQTPVSELVSVQTKSGDLTGVYAPDGLSAYLTNSDKSKFYVIEYLAGRQTEFRYPAVMKMIIANLVLIKEAPATQQSAESASSSESTGI